MYRNVAAEMSPDRNGLTETASLPNRPDRIGQTENSCTCYSKWMIQNEKKEQHNGFSEFISKVILPCTTDLGESLKQIMEKHHKRNIFKPTVYLNQAQSYLKEKIWYPLANVEVLSMKFHAGNVHANTLDKRSETRALDWKNTTWTLCLCLNQCFPIFFCLAPPFLTNKFISSPYQWRTEVWWCPGRLLDCMSP